MSNTKDNSIRANIALAALDPYLERNIVSPKETVIRGKDFVEWGDGNAYPDYLLDLTKTVPTLRPSLTERSTSSWGTKFPCLSRYGTDGNPAR